MQARLYSKSHFLSEACGNPFDFPKIQGFPFRDFPFRGFPFTYHPTFTLRQNENRNLKAAVVLLLPQFGGSALHV
jgi:hypothetical protein